MEETLAVILSRFGCWVWLRQWAEACRSNVGLVDSLVVELFVVMFKHVDDEKKAVHNQRPKRVLEHSLLVDQRYARVLEGNYICRFR